MNDLRERLPECPLEYQVPRIPGNHTALVIETRSVDLSWQERMLPWTLASLINNTDLVMKGVHLYVACEDGTQDRIQTALKRIDLPPGSIITKDPERHQPLILFGKYGHGYDSVVVLDVNYWAFRGVGKAQDRADDKLPFGHVLRYIHGWAVADYNFHIENDIARKDTWVQMSMLPPTPGDPSGRGHLAPTTREKIRDFLVDAADRARWLHDANTAVYGEDYKKQGKNIAASFFNEADPNWHIDASILHYTAFEINNYFADWARNYQHLGTEALVALYLFKTEQHAYNLADSVMIESSYTRAKYPRLCNMRFADVDAFRSGTKEIMGSLLNIKMN